jgi:hypothetical protein
MIKIVIRGPIATCDSRLAAGCWLLAAGCWLLANIQGFEDQGFKDSGNSRIQGFGIRDSGLGIRD